MLHIHWNEFDIFMWINFGFGELDLPKIEKCKEKE
jgi:hypothetical protein